MFVLIAQCTAVIAIAWYAVFASEEQRQSVKDVLIGIPALLLYLGVWAFVIYAFFKILFFFVQIIFS